MGDTSIEWTEKTWNCIRGCTPVSPGCKNCYAAKIAKRFSFAGGPYEGLVRINAKGERTDDWSGDVHFVESHLLDPLKWKQPKRVFVNSMSDLFHGNVTDEMRDQIFAVMALCPQHSFQVLTKRPERMLAYFNRPDNRGFAKSARNPAAWYVWHQVAPIQARVRKETRSPFHWTEYAADDSVAPWPLPNVWLGVSVEDQKTANERIPLLLQTPAAKRFISAEPLLEPVDLEAVPLPDSYLRMNGITGVAQPLSEKDNESDDYRYFARNGFKLDWVIVGGESGPGARPMHPEWARSLRDQCKAAGVPYFFKQWGEWAPVDLETRCKPHDQYWFDENTLLRRLGKKAAGHLLDGQEWHQFPQGVK